MKAWQYIGAGQPLTLNEIDEPVAQPGELAVTVKAVGLCHSDVGILEGVIPEALLGSVPQTLGHEVAGVVNALGEGVTGFSIGDRIGLHMGAHGPGMGIPGGYASTVTVPATNVVRVPDNVTFPQAAAATDAGMTPYHAIATAAGVTAGTRVGIIGLGGLGFNAAQVALALGAEVYAAEPRTEVHAIATEFGVTEVVTDVSELADQQLDVIADFAGFGTTTAGAVLAVRPGGTVVLVGVGRAEMTINTPVFIQNEVHLVGSSGGNLEDLAAYYQLVADGKVNPVLSTIGFDEIKDGLERVADGKVTGRLVAVLGE